MVELASPEVRLSGEPLSIILQIIREALANARNHAHAASIQVHGITRPGGYRLEIQDDGCGFEPAGPGNRSGLGLYLMQERAAEIGAHFRIDSRSGGGCRVVLDLTFPLKHRKTT
jgi:nitrate/nitrite-specific signal transduction histidine kinase